VGTADQSNPAEAGSASEKIALIVVADRATRQAARNN
jgi:hypothetical protein